VGMTRNILVNLRISSYNLVGSSEERLKYMWYDFITTKFKEILRETLDLIYLAQD
jgi:hypothetical protein